jgi:exodeoxyribonuclease VII large subunit
LIETPLQGTETEQGVIGALDQIALNSHLFDVVAIIRGGGSQSDLSWFDSYNIAYHVTQFPLPVITGIGHDKDESVTDMVANVSLKTPTAVADFLIDSVAGAENHIIELSSAIISVSSIIIEKNKNRIEASGIKLVPLARIMMSEVKDELSTKIIKITNIGKELIFKAGLIQANQKSKLSSAAKSCYSGMEMVIKRHDQNLRSGSLNFIGTNKDKLSGMVSTLQLLKPENVLQRGYSITSINGTILKKNNSIKIDDIIDTQLHEGSFRSRVTEKKGRLGEGGNT